MPTEGRKAAPRAGNDSGGGQLGYAITSANRSGPNDYVYIVVQEAVWEPLAKRIGPELGLPDLATDARFAKIADRRKNQNEMWPLIDKFADPATPSASSWLS